MGVRQVMAVLLPALRRPDGSFSKEAKLKTVVQLQAFLNAVLTIHSELLGTRCVELRSWFTC